MPLHPALIRVQLARAVARDDAAIDLGYAALLLAHEEYPWLEPSAYLARLDDLARRTRRQLGSHATAADVVAALGEELFVVEGFRGNDGDYYDPRNSFLNEVLDRRLGIPITLSVVYLEVARRLGLAASGIGLPGHFVVEVRVPERRLIDPFDGGRQLSEADCAERVRQTTGGRARFRPEMLAPMSKREILVRMLNNLKAIYVRTEDTRRLFATIDRLLLLDPHAIAEYRDRGAIAHQIGFEGQALADLRRYLHLAPGAVDADAVRRALIALQRAPRWCN